MADTKISALVSKAIPGSGDLIPIVDVSDTSMAPTGSDKQTTFSGVYTLLGTLTEVAVSGTTSLSSSAFGKLHVCSGTSGNYSVVLPTAVGFAGQSIRFRMAPGLTKLVTLSTSSSQTIDGAASRIMWAGEAAQLESDGSNWFKISGRSIPLSARFTSTVTKPIPQRTWTVVPMGSQTSGPAFMYDSANKQAVIPRSGNYIVSCSVYMSGTVSQMDYYLAPYVNTTVFPDHVEVSSIFDGSAPGVSNAILVSVSSGNVVNTSVYLIAADINASVASGAAFLTILESPSW